MKSTIISIRSIVSFPVFRTITMFAVFLVATILADCVCNRVEAASLTYASFQEFVAGTSGLDDLIPEAIAVDESGSNWFFRGTATAYGGIVPMADIQGQYQNTGETSSVVEIFYAVSVTPTGPNAPASANVPVRYTINASVNASASDGFVRSRTFFNGGSGWSLVVGTTSDWGAPINYSNTRNAQLMPGLGWTLGIKAEALIYPGSGSYQAVIDPIFEIDPNAMIEGNDGLMYHATELYEMAYSPNLVPIPAAFLLFGSSLVGIIGIRKKLKK